MRFLMREILYSNPCPEVFPPARVAILFRNSSQKLTADVLQIRPRYIPSASLPTDRSLFIQHLKRLTVGITTRRPGFRHREFQVGFVVTEVTTKLVFPSPFLLLVSILPPKLHTRTHIPFIYKPTLHVK